MSAYSLPPRKRRRTRLACNPCRVRKIGCDGARPFCASCALKELPSQCVYTNNAHDVPSFQRDQNAGDTSQMESQRRSPPEAIVPDLLSFASGRERTDGQGQSPHPHGQVSIPEQEANQTFTLGPSSNFFFMQKVAETAKQTEPGQSQPNAVFNSIDKFIEDVGGFPAVQSQDLTYDLDTVALPERSLADNILGAYWDLSHPLFPILHQPSFATTYEKLWQPSVHSHSSGRRAEQNLFYATLNIALALGSKVNEKIPSQQRTRLAEAFYQRSQRLVSIETLDIFSLEVVQLLLLRGLYLQYTSYASRCWNTVGVALRVAQGLGLHLEQGGLSSSADNLKREMGRRIWYHCVFLDLLSATTFGRPVFLRQPYSIPLPEELDDEFLTVAGSGHSTQNKPSRMSFFIHSIKLCGIWSDILDRVNSPGNGRDAVDDADTTPSDISIVHSLCSRLDQLLDGLPTHLKSENCGSDYSGPSASCFRMQARVMESRVLYLRLLLLRPSLITAVQRRGSDQQATTKRNAASHLRENALKDINLFCVSTAHTVLEVLHQDMRDRLSISAWHALNYTFAATSVLLAASLCPELEVNLEIEPAKESWERALAIFDFYQSSTDSAISMLEALRTYRLRLTTGDRQGSWRYLLFEEPFVGTSNATELHAGPNTGQTDDNWLFDHASSIEESWWVTMKEECDSIFYSDMFKDDSSFQHT